MGCSIKSCWWQLCVLCIMSWHRALCWGITLCAMALCIVGGVMLLDVVAWLLHFMPWGCFGFCSVVHCAPCFLLSQNRKRRKLYAWAMVGHDERVASRSCCEVNKQKTINWCSQMPLWVYWMVWHHCQWPPWCLFLQKQKSGNHKTTTIKKGNKKK